jgi:hypothetical protein
LLTLSNKDASPFNEPAYLATLVFGIFDDTGFSEVYFTSINPNFLVFPPVAFWH